MDQQKISIRFRLEYLAYRMVAALIRALPLETASFLSGHGWRIFAPLSRRHPRALEHAARAWPELDAREHRKMVSQMWQNLGQVFAESFHLQEIVASGRIAFAADSQPDDVLPVDRNFIACAPHLGNWEVGAAAVMSAGGRPAGIYQRVKNPLVDADLRAMRLPYYPGGLFPKQKDAARKALLHLRAGGALVTMADLRDMSGIAVPFFGHPAHSSPFPALAARSLSVPLYACIMARTPKPGRAVSFTLHLRPVFVPHTGDRDADVKEATATLQATFEDFVRQYPGQFMWAHRRWG